MESSIHLQSLEYYPCLIQKEWLLAVCYGWTWIGNSLYLFAYVVKRYALTQPQRHRGTEAIFSAWTHPHNSAKSQKGSSLYRVGNRSWVLS